jgi:hypothetical protein
MRATACSCSSFLASLRRALASSACKGQGRGSESSHHAYMPW